VVEPQERRGQTFQLADEVTVGRAAGCGVRLEDAYTSSIHARLFRRNGSLWVEDLGSTNGTWVNAERISSAMKLGKGDLLQVGGTVFEVSR
jgi:pSer/pThr/pTyr-binding forkhead associated (FHA) protein